MRICVVVRVGAALIVLASVACAGGPRRRPVEGGPVDTGPRTLTTARQYLEGRWALTSFEVRPPGRDPLHLNGSGTLVYDAFGNLSMEIRVDDATARILEEAGIPSIAGAISMTGRTAVDMQARTLTYIQEGQPLLTAPSGPLGPTRPRHWEVEGRTLTLTTLGDDKKPVSIARWEKSE